jgi:hypothetical protein
MKAAKAPKERQSRAVFGLVKLKANRTKKAALTIASDHRP